MTSIKRIRAIFDNKPADRVGFWSGIPVGEAQDIYYKHFNVKDEEGLSLKLQNDFIYISPEPTWRHPEGKPMFDYLGGNKRISLNQDGVFADCEDIKEVEKFEWPDIKFLDFNSTREKVKSASSKGLAVFGGMYSFFFHAVADFFGMENYFVKMFTNPEVVEAVTEKVVDFYLEANERCFEAMGDMLQGVMYSNDFGSQQNLLVGVEQFKRFLLPGIKKLTEQAKSYNLKVLWHSCGAISSVIPLLIDAGIDALHPLQAKARGMEAETLAREYKNDLVFIGGVDAQELMPFGTPELIKNEVRRLKRIFGDRYVASPSHEALLPNVPPENIIALRDAVLEA